jgi:hypothetical protein
MKKASLLLFLLASLWSIGQTSLGFSAGYGAHQVYFDPAVNQKVQPHLDFRVGLQYLNKKNAGVSLELAYSEGGWQIDDEDSSFSTTWNQPELRFFSHFNIGKGVHRMPVQLGPFLGYANGDFPTSDRLRFGLSLGTGYALQQGKNTFQLMLHYRQDLIPIFPVDDYLYSLPQSMTLSIGYYRAL